MVVITWLSAVADHNYAYGHKRGQLSVHRLNHRNTFHPLLPAHRYSHSMVAGGLPLTSYTTRLNPRTSLMMRFETLPSKL